MQKFLKASLATLAVLGVSLITNLAGGQAQAATMPDPLNTQAAIIPLEIEPVCSNAATGQAFWKVTNKNLQTVNVHWTNLYNNAQADYLASNGSSQLVTSYDASDANNTTRFMSGNDTNQTNATKAACAPTTPVNPTPPTPVDCIDGKVQQNVVVTFLSPNSVKLTAKDGKQFCEDTTIFFSSYIMPANYDGNGFYNNPTAFPQAIYSSVSATIAKNMPVNETLMIELPNNCNNIQVDVYYGPEIPAVGANGHGTQNIMSNVYRSTGACPTTPGTTTPSTPQPPINGGKGAGEETTPVPATVTPQPTAPVTPATPKVLLPKTLPNTGSNILFTLWAIPAIATIAGFAAAEAYQKRRNMYALPPNYWQ